MGENWMNKKSETWKNKKSEKMSSDEWKNNLRISKEDFQVLLKVIRPFAVTRLSKV